MSSESPGDGGSQAPSQEQRSNSFVVVIRCKPGASGGSAAGWHGSVEHAQSHDRLFFVDYRRLDEFIAAHSEATAMASTGGLSCLRQFLQKLTIAVFGLL